MSKKNKWGSIFSAALAVTLVFAAQGETQGKGKVLGISGRLIEISLGETDGVKVGTQLQLIRYKEIKRGDKVIRTDKLNIAEVEIVKFEGGSAFAKMLRSYRPLKDGDLALFTAPVVEAAPVPDPVPVVKAKPKPAPVVETVPEPKPEPAPAPVVEASPAEVEVKEEKQTTGILNIKTKPSGAKLNLNGKALGTSPKTILAQEAGRYQVRAAKEGYYPAKGTVQVKAGQSSDLTLQLKRLEGDLKVNSMPKGVALLIDGKPRGKTNLHLYLRPGKHTLILQKKGYKQLKKLVNLPANQAVTLNLALEKHGAPKTEGMIYIPGGEFIMGSKNGNPNEQPLHKITVDGFYIDKYEVSNADYRKFVKATGHIEPAFQHDNDLNKPNLPVVGVTWKDAGAYAKWAGKRLPTEAEWEKAARGFDGRTYPWGNKYEQGRANKAGAGDSYQFTAPARSFAGGASPYGVINLAGNIWEWCADWYAGDYYAKSPNFNPKGPVKGERRAIRGGSWEDAQENLRSSNRYAEEPKYFGYNLGFRCVK